MTLYSNLVCLKAEFRISINSFLLTFFSFFQSERIIAKSLKNLKDGKNSFCLTKHSNLHKFLPSLRLPSFFDRSIIAKFSKENFLEDEKKFKHEEKVHIHTFFYLSFHRRLTKIPRISGNESIYI